MLLFATFFFISHHSQKIGLIINSNSNYNLFLIFLHVDILKIFFIITCTILRNCI